VLPGKSYSIDEVVGIAARRWWVLLLPMLLGAAIAFGVSKRLPNQYRSQTLIMLVPQRVPDSYVKSTVTVRVEDRLATLEDQILSRSRLERIILDLNLYEDLRRTLPMEDVVMRMRRDIGPIKSEGKDSSSFQISYTSNDARTAQKTTERLASLFIEENLRDRENQAEATNQFLDSQLEDARRRLIEHERKLEKYRSQYSGELPSQAAANLQSIQNVQVQLQTLTEAADRARERRLLLERQLVEVQSDPIAVPPPAAGAAVAPVESTAQQLQAAETRLQLLQTHAKPDHPDVKMMQRTIRDLRAKLDAEVRPTPDPGAEPSAVAPESLRQRRLRDLKSQVEDVDRQIAEKQEQEHQLRGVILTFQTKLDAVPKHESELVELTRDYATLQTSYQSLLTKREESKIAANLERRNIGEQFKVLDPASVPERPFSPNRLVINLGGAGGGLVLGVLITFLPEFMDTALKSEENVIRLLDVRVLGLVPTMFSVEDRQRRRLRSIVVSVASVLAVGSSALLVWWRLRP
jgi:polysaccharide chain length determinant protein (PEP-CTERM system associated)